MSEISEIRPAYPVVKVKRRDHEPESQRKRPKPKRVSKSAKSIDDDAPPPLIDEYV